MLIVNSPNALSPTEELEDYLLRYGDHPEQQHTAAQVREWLAWHRAGTLEKNLQLSRDQMLELLKKLEEPFYPIPPSHER